MASIPGIMTIAEESTAWPGVSQPVHAGGLGFGFKWNMGFMHDTLRYMARDPVHRKHHHDDMTFGLLYAFTENFVLPLSHDEVVHGKGSLLARWRGDDWQKFATLRAYYAFMWGYPGKKLLFMGQEFAPVGGMERGARPRLAPARRARPHAGMQQLIRDLNRPIATLPALHARDCEGDGFEWLDRRRSPTNSVFAWLRQAGDAPTRRSSSSQLHAGAARRLSSLPLPRAGRWRERSTPTPAIYGGSGIGQSRRRRCRDAGRRTASRPARRVTLPPLATLIFAYEG